MSQTTGNTSGTGGNFQRSSITSVTSGQGIAGQRTGSDVTAKLQASSTKPTQGQSNQHGQTWKEKTAGGSQNPQQNTFRGRDDKNQYSGSKK